MNPDVKAKWLEALRSGGFKQGYGRLNDSGAYCCLGVLCEIAARDGVAKRQDLGGEVSYGNEYQFSGLDLPHVVSEWAGLTGDTTDLADPEIRLPGLDEGTSRLSAVNDNGASFNEIADLIEEQL